MHSLQPELCLISHIIFFLEEVFWIVIKLYFIYSVARFLESRGMIEDALEVATDPDYRFELAIQLGKLEIAKVSAVKLCN